MEAPLPIFEWEEASNQFATFAQVVEREPRDLVANLPDIWLVYRGGAERQLFLDALSNQGLSGDIRLRGPAGRS